jgi:hypothetical protein
VSSVLDHAAVPGLHGRTRLVRGEAQEAFLRKVLVSTEPRGGEEPDMWEWRREFIIPRYQEAGIRKFANVVPEGWPIEEPQQAEGEPFVSGNFRTVEDAEAWFRSS